MPVAKNIWKFWVFVGRFSCWSVCYFWLENIFQDVGASCQVLKRFLHPWKDVAGKYPNATSQEHLDKLVTIRQEEKSVNRSLKCCIVFCHDDFPNIELHCVEWYTTVIEEGLPIDYFDQVEAEGNTNEEANDMNTEKEVPVIQDTDLVNSIARLRAEGCGVVDDNKPAPENIPQPAATQN